MTYLVQHKNKGCSWNNYTRTPIEEFAFNAAERLVESDNYDTVRVITSDGDTVFMEGYVK